MPLTGTPFGCYNQGAAGGTPGNLSNILNNSGSFIIPNLGSNQPRELPDTDDIDYTIGRAHNNFNNTQPINFAAYQGVTNAFNNRKSSMSNAAVELQ